MSIFKKVWSVLKELGEPEGLAEAIRLAACELDAVVLDSVRPELSLRAVDAEIVDEQVQYDNDEGVVRDVMLRRIVRNPQGEYFLITKGLTKPYVKHLSQARAKLVLKEKYRPPAQTADPVKPV